MSGYLLAPICFGLGVTYYALMRKDLQLQEQNRIEYAEYVSHILKDTVNPSDEGENGDGDGEKEKEEKEQVSGTGDQISNHINNDKDNISNLGHVFNLKQRENRQRDSSPNTNSHSRAPVSVPAPIPALRSKSLHNLNNKPLKSTVSPSVEETVDDMYGFPLRSPKTSQDSLKPLSVSNTYLKTKLEHLIWEDRKDGLNRLKPLEEKEKEEVENVVSRILLKGKDSSIEKISASPFTAKVEEKENSSSSTSSGRRKYSGHLRNNQLFTIPVSVTPWKPKLPTVYQTNMALIQYDLPLPSSLSQTQQLKQKPNEKNPLVVTPIKKLPPKPKPQIKSTCTNLETNPPPLLPRCPTTRIPKFTNNNNIIIEDEICSEVYENFKYLDVDSCSIQTNDDQTPVNSLEIVIIEKEENCSDLLKSNIIENPESCDNKNSNDTEIDNENETDRKTSSTITVIHNPSENSIDSNISNPRNFCTTEENISTLEKEKELVEDTIPLSQPQESKTPEQNEQENTFFEINSSPSRSSATENDDDKNDGIENLRNNYSQPDSTHFLFSPPSPTLKSDSVLSLCLQNPIMDSFSSSFMEFPIENEVEVDDNISINNNNEKEEETEKDSAIISSNNNNDNIGTNMYLKKSEEKSASSRLDYLQLHELCVKDILQEIQFKSSRTLSNSKIGIKRTQSLPDILNNPNFQPDWHTQKIIENIGITEQVYRQLVSFITKPSQWSPSSHYSAWLKVVMPSELLNQLKNSINIFNSKSVVAASLVIAFLVIVFSWIMTSFSNPTVEKYGMKSSWHW